ncbi:MAG: hypothetical protein CL565_05490 [Alphaproteobacteria bacterium]|nr:hypothetical protein [Alphaproteobacteria bacterium]|tara:strand:- start:1373 stop:1762 length:390 start_codon:yes stop_codon:yes gene_type:complete
MVWQSLKKYLIVTTIIFLCSLPVKADTPPVTYISALPTVPLMPGLEEVGNSEVLFDKAEGRIAAIDAYGFDLKEQNVKNYYREVLPELGWVETDNMVFSRQNEVLAIRLNTKTLDRRSGVTVTFDLQPK